MWVSREFGRGLDQGAFLFLMMKRRYWRTLKPMSRRKRWMIDV